MSVTLRKLRQGTLSALFNGQYYDHCYKKWSKSGQNKWSNYLTIIVNYDIEPVKYKNKNLWEPLLSLLSMSPVWEFP